MPDSVAGIVKHVVEPHGFGGHGRAREGGARQRPLFHVDEIDFPGAFRLQERADGLKHVVKRKKDALEVDAEQIARQFGAIRQVPAGKGGFDGGKKRGVRREEVAEGLAGFLSHGAPEKARESAPGKDERPEGGEEIRSLSPSISIIPCWRRRASA